jgi:hypothetical protein
MIQQVDNPNPDYFVCEIVPKQMMIKTFRDFGEELPKSAAKYKGSILCVSIPPGDAVSADIYRQFDNAIITEGGVGDPQPVKNRKLAEIEVDAGEKKLHFAFYRTNNVLIETLTSHAMISADREKDLVKELQIDSFSPPGGKPPSQIQ